MSALTDAFTAIANAIRNKKGVSTKYTPAQMPNAIASIETGTDTSDATLDSGSRMLSNYTAYAKGTKYTGSMVNRGAVSQTLNPGGSYTVPAGYHDGNGTVSARNLNLQTKTQTVTPSANWSGTNTNNATINKDSNYDGMSQVNVNVPMLRDNTLMTADTVDTPGTVYNGNTSESNTQKLLRMHPTKDGMSYTGSYLYMKPNSYLGNASAADVLSGKTFSSANGIQLTGTGASGRTITERVLWTNPNPSSAFYAQDINFSSTFSAHSESLLIQYRPSASYADTEIAIYNIKSNSGRCVFGGPYGNCRELISTNELNWSKVSVTAAYEVESSSTMSQTVVPVKISAISGIYDL